MVNPIFIIIVFLYLAAAIQYFAGRRPHYSSLKNTISELGEEGAVNRNRVNLGVFLPVGAALLTIGLLYFDKETFRNLALCLGTGYCVAALFPCDVGSPVYGSWRQSVHNVGGFIQYAGGIAVFGQCRENIFLAGIIPTEAIIGFLVICLVVISIPGFRFRGLIQRLTELIFFAQLYWLSLQ